MPKLILVRGISGSGKSTWCAEYKCMTNERVLIVNRDKIREILFGSESAHGVDEYLVTSVQDVMITHGLSRDYIVVVDNTNIEPDHMSKMVDMAYMFNAPVEVVMMNTDLSTALSRNAARERQVPEKVIISQWHRLNETKDWKP